MRDGRPTWDAAHDALAELARRKIPLVFAGSGTRMELEFLRREIENRHPFMTENGGALFIPRGYFSAKIPDAVTTSREYHCISQARPYVEVMKRGCPIFSGRGSSP